MTAETPEALEPLFYEQNDIPSYDTDHLTVFIESDSWEVDRGFFFLVKPEWVKLEN